MRRCRFQPGVSKARLMLSFSVSGDAQAASDRGRGRGKEGESSLQPAGFVPQH